MCPFIPMIHCLQFKMINRYYMKVKTISIWDTVPSTCFNITIWFDWKQKDVTPERICTYKVKRSLTPLLAFCCLYVNIYFMDFAAIPLARNGDVSTWAKYSRADVKQQEIYLPLLQQLESIKEPLTKAYDVSWIPFMYLKRHKGTVLLTTCICFQSEL